VVDLGYMINHAMFQRNGRSGYVLKPPAVRLSQKKDLLAKRTLHSFEVTIISAQQLPRPRDASGLEVLDKGIVDPYVEVTLYVPDWPVIHHVGAVGAVGGDELRKGKGKEETMLPPPPLKITTTNGEDGTDDDLVNEDDDYYYVNDEDTTPPSPSPRSLPLLLQPLPLPPPIGGGGTSTTTPARSISSRTSVVKKNGFNPVWEEKLNIMFDCVGDMMDLVFVRFVVRQEKDKDGEEPLAVYCASMGSLQCGTHPLFFGIWENVFFWLGFF
jgi:phosphatidylinositol phospholipase C, delta